MTTTDALNREIIADGKHAADALFVLGSEIKDPKSIDSIQTRAREILESAADPIGGVPDEPRDGLLYGLIQSGKTSIIIVVAAMAVDNGFRSILILTTDNNPLYDQTLERVRGALRGIEVLGKKDWADVRSFDRKMRGGTPCAAVRLCHSRLRCLGGSDKYMPKTFRGVTPLVKSSIESPTAADAYPPPPSPARSSAVARSRVRRRCSRSPR